MAKTAIQARILKGFRDHLPEISIARNDMIRRLVSVFSSFGYVPIDTPALEYTEILLGKGSEETDKQLYRFSDNGGRDIALRFDLTVPLARFAAMHAHELGMPFRRYHVAPVWRAEKPQRGRYREFLQCDFDIIGTRSLAADAEVVSVIHRSLSELRARHVIRLNNRLLLSGLLEALGVSETSSAVLRTVDKLDKQGEDAVSKELTTEGGLTEGQAADLLAFLSISKRHGSSAEILNEASRYVSQSESGKKGVAELRRITEILLESGVPSDSFAVDLSIARGLDYYTGTIFETALCDLPNIGSVCSGGRYDNLVSLYSSLDLPGVGASVGLDRLLAALEELQQLSLCPTTSEVLVTLLEDECAGQSAALAAELRDSGLSIELYPQPGKLAAQLKYADKKSIPFVVIAGKREWEQGRFIVKDLREGRQFEDLVRDSLPAFFQEILRTQE